MGWTACSIFEQTAVAWVVCMCGRQRVRKPTCWQDVAQHESFCVGNAVGHRQYSTVSQRYPRILRLHMTDIGFRA